MLCATVFYPVYKSALLSHAAFLTRTPSPFPHFSLLISPHVYLTPLIPSPSPPHPHHPTPSPRPIPLPPQTPLTLHPRLHDRLDVSADDFPARCCWLVLRGFLCCEAGFLWGLVWGVAGEGGGEERGVGDGSGGGGG